MVLRQMMTRLSFRLIPTLISGLLFVSTAAAQTVTCPTYVEQALDAVSDACGSVGRNEVCYGNNSIDADFAPDQAPPEFADPGDLASVLGLERLTTAPLMPDRDIWGVAIMALQANLDDALPGQNITFILFGDAEVTPDEASAENFSAPMQAFRLETRVTGVNCEDVPESGMLVQAPEDTTVTVSINGVVVNVGSSALFTTDAGELTVDTIEGFVTVTSDGVTEIAGEGTGLRVRPGRRPLRAVLSRNARIAKAPWRILPRSVRPMPPPPTGEIVELNGCFQPTAAQAARRPVTVTGDQPVVLRFTIAEQSLALARILQRQTYNRLVIDGEASPPYTRIGPWRGENAIYGETVGMEFYWLVEDIPRDGLRVLFEVATKSGRPIVTEIDGVDPDSEPEVIPARRRVYCLVRTRAS